MATGDKIYLADKSTLDLVKAAVDNIAAHTSSIKSDLNSHTDNIRADLSALSSKVDTIVSSDKGDVLTVSDLQKIVSSDSAIPVSTGYSKILDITGPGELYFVLSSSYQNTSYSNEIYVQVVVDGLTIYRGKATTAAGATTRENTALFWRDLYEDVPSPNGDKVLGIPEVSSLSGVYMHMLCSNSISRHANTARSEQIFSTRPIRFRESLVINAYATTTASRTYYSYKLD